MVNILLLTLLLVTASSASGEVYRWQDRAGVLHFSNSLDDVPAKYRNKAKAMNYGGGQKGDSNSVQVPAPGAVSSPHAMQATAADNNYGQKNQVPRRRDSGRNRVRAVEE